MRASDLHPVFADIEDEDSPDILSRHVADAVRQALTAAKPADRVDLANKLLQELNTRRPHHRLAPPSSSPSTARTRSSAGASAGPPPS